MTAEALKQANESTEFENGNENNGGAEEKTEAEISEDEAWSEVVLFDQINTPIIPTTFLPEWLGEYVNALIQSTQVPAALPVMQALAILSTALQGKFEVCPFGDNYIEPLCVWTITVLPPASRKTAIVNALVSPLIKWEAEEARKIKPLIAQHAAEQKVLKKRIEELEKKAGKKEDDAERKSLANEISVFELAVEPPLVPPRLFTGDVTPERLQGLMAEHDGRMSVLSDEGGIFEVMSGLYNDGRANLDIFLKSHAGSAVRVDRSSRTVVIDKPVLSFGITVQPQIISEFSQGSKKRFRGIGTCGRFLWAIPESNVGHRDVRKRVSIPDGCIVNYENRILNLLKINPAVDENGNSNPWKLKLSEEARESWLQFAQYIESRQGEGGDLEPIQDWSGKLPGAALRIAGLLHVCRVAYSGTTEMSEYLIIGKEDLEKALDFCELLIEHAKAAFNIIGADSTMEDAKFIFNWLTKEVRDVAKQRDLHRLGRFNKSRLERLLKAVEILQERHILSAVKKEDTRKPTIYYKVNPGIYEVLAT